MTSVVDKITLKAYAKVNLTLDVVGRRADGYHLLRSVMQSISLADTITLQTSPQNGISIQCDHPLVPTDETNLCWRAAQAFWTYTGLPGPLRVTISLTKAIPVGAGLGGGSADAAAVLYGMNALHKTELTIDELQEIGLTIGADVPFCLQGGTCLVEGIGERVTPLKSFPELAMVLVKPQASVSTATVYGKLKPSAHGGTSTERLQEYLQSGSLIVDNILENALESVTIQLVSEVGLWKKRLLDHGAICSLMSGSGPTVFGLFSSPGQAGDFHDRFREDGQIYVASLMDKGVDVSEMNGGDQQ